MKAAAVQPFRLLKFFLISIALVIPGVTSATAYFADLALRKGVFAEARDFASEVAQNIYNHLESDFLIPTRASGLEVNLERHPEQYDQVRRIVDLATYAHQVERVYFFDEAGKVTFSTLREHIGRESQSENEALAMALNGKIACYMGERWNRKDISAFPADANLLETYVPVQQLARGPQSLVSVVEVYQDTAAYQSAVLKARGWIVTAALGSMGVLCLIFALITLKADRTIRTREEEIIASNQALQELSSSLESEVKDRTRQLLEKQKLASVGTLAAGIAHELNTPLATVAVCADGSLSRLATQEISPESIDDVREYLRVIKAEVFRCKQITSNVLDFARDGSPPRREPLDLNGVSRQAVDLLRLGHPGESLPIALDLSDGAVGAWGDPNQIRQVVHNLLTNSLSAVRDQPNPRIILSTRVVNGHVLLECNDNGEGMSPQVRAKAFEPFFTTKPAGEGVGLGLSVSYGILQQHGGRIEVLDTKGPGTTVRVTLQAHRSEPELMPARPAEGEA